MSETVTETNAQRYERLKTEYEQAQQSTNRLRDEFIEAKTALLNEIQGTQCALTNREQEVLECVRRGLVNKEIAVQLGIEVRTVKFHVSSLLAKFDAQRRQELWSSESIRSSAIEQ